MKGWRLILLAVCMVWNMSVAAFSSQQLVTDAKKQIGVTKYYDPAYTRLSYPMGDVPLIKGVCTQGIIELKNKYLFNVIKWLTFLSIDKFISHFFD